MRTRWLFVCLLTACSCDKDPAADPPKDDGGSIESDAATTPDASTPVDASVPNDAGDAGKKPVGPLFAFVGSNDGKIRAYLVDEVNGTWTFKKESDAGSNPSFLAFDPSRRRVVATDETGGSGAIRSFTFDPASGGLTDLGSKPAGGAGSTHVAFDPNGKWVVVANYTGGNMSIFPIDESGVLGNASDTKASGAKSHWAGTNPSGTHVFVPALEANVVAQYTLNAQTGKLTDNGTAALPANAGPRHLAFHPNETYAYTINELAVTVTTFAFDKATGKLTPKQTISALPQGQSANGVTGAEIVVHPNGKHVYASTRGYNSIAQLSVNASDGTLTLVNNAPTGGNQPRSFGIDPEGTLLFAGNQAINQVVGFRIAPETGALTSLGKTVDVVNPTFVGLARIP